MSNASIFTGHEPSGFAQTKYPYVYSEKWMQTLSVLTAVPSWETGGEHFSFQSRGIVSLMDILQTGDPAGPNYLPCFASEVLPPSSLGE